MIKINRLFIIITILLVIVSCTTDNGDIEKACLPEPGGIIITDKLNVTIYTKVNDIWLEIENLTAVNFEYKEGEMSLTLTKTNEFSPGTDWQTIPSLDISRIKVSIDDETYAIEVNEITTRTNRIEVILNKTDNGVDVEFKDYQKCVDTIDSFVN